MMETFFVGICEMVVLIVQLFAIFSFAMAYKQIREYRKERWLTRGIVALIIASTIDLLLYLEYYMAVFRS